MVDEIGPENVVHIVTDNGSNYKKACKALGEVYEHILWTPCLAHTVNLMLKDIARRPEHSGTIKQYKILLFSLYLNILLTYLVAHTASWWMMFGSSTPKLQYLAMRLVSQCCSSSGCERNWSTFALLHTKVRNRLSHKKLNKLVYVNYNLRLRLEEVSGPPIREEGDFIDQLAHLSFYDENNPVREWMEYGRSNRAPVLDEDDDDGDVPLPSHIVRDQINLSDLRDTTGDACISDWARRHVGDTHLGKRKFQRGHTKGDSKRQKQKGKATAKSVNSDTSTDDGDGERSPPYQETGDSSSAGDGDGSDGADAGGGGGGGSGGGIPIRFTGIHCTYICTPVSDYEY